jgi:serine/threonine-protein phosphatase 2A regulatory subunit B''
MLQVISRIYFCVNRSWSGRITVPELRKSNFLQVSTPVHLELASSALPTFPVYFAAIMHLLYGDFLALYKFNDQSINFLTVCCNKVFQS